MRKGIWFGKLADGTEASISDIAMQDLTVVQAARIRLVNREHPLDKEATLQAAQYMRQRYPELNREETASQYSESKFARTLLSEDAAASAVKVHLAPPSATLGKCQDKTLELMRQHTMRHPHTLSRLGSCCTVPHRRVRTVWSGLFSRYPMHMQMELLCKSS